MLAELLTMLMVVSQNGKVTSSIESNEDISISTAHCLTDISKRYFSENQPVAIQLPILKYCEKPTIYHSQNEDVLLVNFNKDSKYQQIILACYGEKQTTSFYLNKPGGALVVLPDLDVHYMKIHVQLSLRKIQISLGNLGVPAVIISSRVFTSKK